MEVALLNTTLTLMVCTAKPVDFVCVQTLLTLLNTAKTLAYKPIYIVEEGQNNVGMGLGKFEQNVG